MAKDYYKILGIEKSATADEIKRAYKKLAVKYHPDVNKDPGSEEKFKEANEAYQVLSDPQKRSNYDQFGSADMGGGFNKGSGQGFGGFDFSGFSQQGGGSFDGIDDIFDMFFGGGRGRTKREKRGNDIEIIIELGFEEAVFGTEKEIAYSVKDRCPECKGAGGTNPKKCPECNGTGQVSRATRTVLGSFMQTMVCPKCNGKGDVPENICKKCSGAGTTRQTKNIKVKIPAGVNNGSTIRVAGGGEAGDDGNGDLYLRIRVRPSKDFEREGANIYSDVEIPYLTAVLGGKIDVKTVDGALKLSIPSGTESHTQFKLRGKGAPVPNQKGHRGDHIVMVKIRVPKKLSREERELLEKIQDN